MNTRDDLPADVVSDDSQAWFDIDYASGILERTRTQLAAAKITLALRQAGLIEDPDTVDDDLADAIAYHLGVIAVMREIVNDASSRIST